MTYYTGTQMRTFRGDIISKPHVYSYGKRIAFIIYQNIVLIEIDKINIDE